MNETYFMAESGDLRQPTANEQNQATRRLRPGPKQKLIRYQVLKPEAMKVIRRPERCWSQDQKIGVLVFLNHQIVDSLRAQQ